MRSKNVHKNNKKKKIKIKNNEKYFARVNIVKIEN